MRPEKVRTLNPKPLHGYLAHKKTPTPLGAPQDPRHRPTVRSKGVAFSCKRGNPVHPEQVRHQHYRCNHHLKLRPASRGVTLNPDLLTLHPEPYTLDPNTETRNQNPETRNPKPETRNPKPETRNPKPEIQNQCTSC